MTYLAPTPTRPILSHRFEQTLSPVRIMSTSQMSQYSGSYVSTPEDERNLSWGSESSTRPDQLPVSWSLNSSGSNSHSHNHNNRHHQHHHHHSRAAEQPYPSAESLLDEIDLPQSNDYYSYSNHIATSTSGCVPWDYQQQEQQRLDSPEFYIKTSPHDSPVQLSQILPSTPQSALSQHHSPSTSPHIPSLSPSLLPAQPVIPPQQPASKKRSQNRRSTALSHSVVERRYREGINSKIELLHRVLGHADQHSTAVASGASSTSDEQNYESIFSFDDLSNIKSLPNAAKARKADVLSNAIDYVKRAEQQKLALIHEVEFWKRRVVSLEDEPRGR